jgi:hypothetical protein
MTYIPLGSGDEEIEPVNLEFHEQVNQSTPDLQPADLVTLNDPFDDPDSPVRTIYAATGSNHGTLSVSGGTATVSHAAGEVRDSVVNEGDDVALPQMMVTIDVPSSTGTAGDILIGVAKDGDNVIGFRWARGPGHAALYQRISGTTQAVIDDQVVAWTIPLSLGFSMVGSSIVGYMKPDGGSWTKIAGGSLASAPYTNPKTIDWTGWKPAFKIHSADTTASTVTFDNLVFGSFGSCGSIRDIFAVTAEDGTPYIVGDEIYALAGRTDARAGAYCAVVKINLTTKAITQVGVIMVSRGGAIQNDNAGQIIRYDDGTYRLSLSSWGDSTETTVRILYKNETVLNLLSGANVVSDMTQLSLHADAGNGWYDPYLQKIGTDWYLAYSTYPSGGAHYPFLELSTDLSTWSTVGSDSSTAAAVHEGTRIKYFNGQYWVLTGGLSDVRVYDTSMVYQGDMLLFTETGASPPHPDLVPFRNYVYCLAFDNVAVVGGVAQTRGHYRQFRARRYGKFLQTPNSDPT